MFGTFVNFVLGTTGLIVVVYILGELRKTQDEVAIGSL